MFLNLFLNAKDAMPEGGTLRVATSNGDGVSVVVSDTGTGIAQEHIQRIYDPFFTTKTAPREGQGKGTGLGLSVTYGIIQEHAGKIRVESQPGAGHNFLSGFPADQEGCQCLKLATIPRRVMSDDILVRGFGADHRRRSRDPRVAGDSAGDWKATKSKSAATADEGLTRIGERPFDLVLLDLALPDRNGIELLAELHAHDSAAASHHDHRLRHGGKRRASAMQAGATNFVQKPWDNEKLLADVRAAVARHRAEEENVQLKRALKQRYNFENIVGKSEPMLKIFDLVAQVAPSRSTILSAGRERDRQRTDRQSHSLELAAARPAVCSGEYRIDAAGPAGIHAVRARQGRVHQRHRVEEGPV